MSSMQERRKVGMMFGVGVALLIGSFTVGPAVAEFISPSGYVKHAPAGSYISADWGNLQKGDFRGGQVTVLPAVAALDGKMVRVSGFSIPLNTATESSRQYIAPNPRGCYYCYPPGVAGVVEVEIRGDKKAVLSGAHLYAYGKFKVASSAADSSLYMLKDAVLMEAP